MSQTRNDDDFIISVAVVLGLAILYAGSPKSPLHAWLTTWTDFPLTVAGAAFRAAVTPHGSAPAIVCARIAINLCNRMSTAAGPLALSGLLVGFYPRLAARYGRLTSWNEAALLAAMLLTGLAGLGTVLSTPLAWPHILRSVALAIASVNILFACACAFVLAWRGDGSRVLDHGPKFIAPETSGPCIPVGKMDSEVLPGHARWLAEAHGEIRIPFERLSRGITILGEKGSGKSRLLFAIHDAIRSHYPHVPILVHDPKGEWYRTYYNPQTDRHFAPHFKDSSAWNIWQDFQVIPELRHALLASAVHAHPADESFWMDQAIDMLDGAANSKDFNEAVKYLSDIPDSKSDDRFLLSIFGTARLGFLDIAKAHLMGGAGPALSIDDYLKFPGRILLLNDPSCADQQYGVFSLFLTAFLLRALSMPDVPAGTLRAVAIIDEALTFHLPPDVDRRIYSLCRSKGLCIIAGAQRLPDRNNDERGEWQNAEYTFAMKVIHQETQAALSKRAGTLLFRQKKRSKSTHIEGSSTSESEQDSSQNAIPPEHFGRIDPRKFVLFHDRGIATGETVDVRREQRDIKLPDFDPLPAALDISRKLMLGDKK